MLMIDCKNDNCYYALYKKTDDDILDVLIEPQAETVVATLSIIDTYIEDSNETGNIYFTGDATTKYKNDIEKTIPYAHFSNEKQNLLNSYYLGLCGLELYNTGIEFETPDRQINNILPLYLKNKKATSTKTTRRKRRYYSFLISSFLFYSFIQLYI